MSKWDGAGQVSYPSVVSELRALETQKRQGGARLRKIITLALNPSSPAPPPWGGAEFRRLQLARDGGRGFPSLNVPQNALRV